MIFYIILVLILVGFTIWLAQLIVSKKNPEFKPEPVEKFDDLNKLDDLVGTVKKPKNQTQPQTNEQTQQADNQDNGEKEYSSALDNTNPQEDNKDPEEEQEEQEPPKTKFSGRRGKPPKRPPRTNLREAMKNSEILGKPKAQK